MNKLRKALDHVRAEEALKANTAEFLRQEIQKRQHRHPVRHLRYALCTLAVLVLTLCSGYVVYNTPVSYISIDINPSVELALNRFDRVVSVDAYNDDGIRILQSVPLKGKNYVDAIDLLLENEVLKEYLGVDALLSFTVVSDQENQLMEGIQSCHQYAEYDSECHSATKALLEPAHQCHMSVGKYRACQALVAADDTLTLETCKDMTMRELRQRLSEAAECEDSSEAESGECTDETNAGHDTANGDCSRGGSGSAEETGNGNQHGHGNGHGHNGWED